MPDMVFDHCPILPELLVFGRLLVLAILLLPALFRSFLLSPVAGTICITPESETGGVEVTEAEAIDVAEVTKAEAVTDVTEAEAVDVAKVTEAETGGVAEMIEAEIVGVAWANEVGILDVMVPVLAGASVAGPHSSDQLDWVSAVA